VAASAVTLSSQERINAQAQTSYGALVECANAAQAQLWATVSVAGKAYYTTPSTTMTVTSIHLPDGRELMAPAHVGDGSPTPAEAIRGALVGSPDGQQRLVDTTNTMAGGMASRSTGGTWVTARCVDAAGRAHEVEFAFQLSL
jgi:hypothetical protein